jgi:hypothetical protein
MTVHEFRPGPNAAKRWPHAPMRARTRRRLAVAILAVLALAGTAVTARWLHTQRQAEAPVEAVRAFLEAVHAADVDAALAMTADEPSGATDLLVPEALSDDWTIGDLILHSWSSFGDTAQVAATIIGPEDAELSASLSLEQTDDGWKVTDPYTTLSVSWVPLPYLEVNGHNIPVDPEQGNHEFAVLPGVYRLYENPPELLAHEGAPVMALGHNWSEVEDDEAPRSAFDGFKAAEGTEDRLNEQVKSYLDECIADGPEQFGCPFGLQDWDLDIDGFTPGPERQWEIVEYPQVAAGTAGPMVTPEQLGLLVRHEGIARVTVADEDTGEEAVLECPITTTDLYFWLDETGQYAIGPNGDPAAPADADGTAWDRGYYSQCKTA